jgi:hypothetical protein
MLIEYAFHREIGREREGERERERERETGGLKRWPNG